MCPQMRARTYICERPGTTRCLCRHVPADNSAGGMADTLEGGGPSEEYDPLADEEALEAFHATLKGLRENDLRHFDTLGILAAKLRPTAAGGAVARLVRSCGQRVRSEEKLLHLYVADLLLRHLGGLYVPLLCEELDTMVADTVQASRAGDGVLERVTRLLDGWVNVVPTERLDELHGLLEWQTVQTTPLAELPASAKLTPATWFAAPCPPAAVPETAVGCAPTVPMVPDAVMAALLASLGQ